MKCGKSVKQCVEFYYLWKKVCPDEYKRLRIIRKKREHDDLLYNLRSRAEEVSSAMILPANCCCCCCRCRCCCCCCSFFPICILCVLELGAEHLWFIICILQYDIFLHKSIQLRLSGTKKQEHTFFIKLLTFFKTQEKKLSSSSIDKFSQLFMYCQIYFTRNPSTNSDKILSVRNGLGLIAGATGDPEPRYRG